MTTFSIYLSRLPTLPGIGPHHQPVVEALSAIHRPVFHKHRPCMWLFTFPQDIWFCRGLYPQGLCLMHDRIPKVCVWCMIVSPRSVFDAWSYPQGLCLMHGVDTFPLPSKCFRTTFLLNLVCMLEDAFITSCTGHVVAPSKVPACGCLLSHRPSDSAGDHILKVCLDAWGWSFPLPPSLFGLETSRHPFA